MRTRTTREPRGSDSFEKSIVESTVGGASVPSSSVYSPSSSPPPLLPPKRLASFLLPPCFFFLTGTLETLFPPEQQAAPANSKKNKKHSRHPFPPGDDGLAEVEVGSAVELVLPCCLCYASFFLKICVFIMFISKLLYQACV